MHEQETKHYTGEWGLESDGSLTMGGQVVSTPIGRDGSTLEERVANARLIAAAPQMLAALEAIRYAVTREAHSSALRRAFAVLDRVNGEER